MIAGRGADDPNLLNWVRKSLDFADHFCKVCNPVFRGRFCRPFLQNRWYIRLIWPWKALQKTSAKNLLKNPPYSSSPETPAASRVLEGTARWSQVPWIAPTPWFSYIKVQRIIIESKEASCKRGGENDMQTWWGVSMKCTWKFIEISWPDFSTMTGGACAQ